MMRHGWLRDVLIIAMPALVLAVIAIVLEYLVLRQVITGLLRAIFPW